MLRPINMSRYKNATMILFQFDGESTLHLILPTHNNSTLVSYRRKRKGWVAPPDPQADYFRQLMLSGKCVLSHSHTLLDVKSMTKTWISLIGTRLQ